MLEKKIELLVARFEKNVALEKFHLDVGNQEGLAEVLSEQGDLILEMLKQLERLSPESSKYQGFVNRILEAADIRLLLQNRVSALLGEISKEIGLLRRSTLQLNNWKKAWTSTIDTSTMTSTTYA